MFVVHHSGWQLDSEGIPTREILLQDCEKQNCEDILNFRRISQSRYDTYIFCRALITLSCS
jgi:hypothetical protein